MDRAAKAALVWKGRIDEQRRSGQSIALFCKQQGFSAPSFYVWRKRLHQKRARPVISGASRAGDDHRSAAVPGRRSGASSWFVPVTVTSADCRGVRIELPGGIVVSLPGDASLELVTAAIRAASGNQVGNGAGAEPSSC